MTVELVHIGGRTADIPILSPHVRDMVWLDETLIFPDAETQEFPAVEPRLTGWIPGTYAVLVGRLQLMVLGWCAWTEHRVRTRLRPYLARYRRHGRHHREPGCMSTLDAYAVPAGHTREVAREWDYDAAHGYDPDWSYHTNYWERWMQVAT